YFQRIDFFEKLGVSTSEFFHRHPPTNRFVPIQKITFNSDSGTIATSLSNCIAGQASSQDESYFLVQYATGEIISNCKQHSGGQGFASAQYFKKHDLARFGVGDSGKGIRESFRVNQSPHYQEEMTDETAILLALKPEVSSVTHLRNVYEGRSNRGLGLSVLRELVKHTHGYLSVISGNGWYFQDGNLPGKSGTMRNGCSYHGTLVSAAFDRGQVANYNDLHNEALRALGLQISIPDVLRFT
ncbi:MAG TPA: hypothetical protein VIS74_04035, partial [Chthoniobacterales bacterium]